MNRDKNRLDELAERASKGDAGALAELRRELGPSMAVIVRRALRAKSAALPITQQVRASAAKLSPSPRGTTLPPRAGLLDRVARSICQTIVGRLQANWAPTFCMHDTVQA